MPYAELKGLLTDIGTEELGHLEMVGTLVHQLTRNLSEEQIKTAGFDTYFVDHTTGVYPQFASGYPWSASTMQVTGDIIADLTEDLAADGAILQEQQPSGPTCIFRHDDHSIHTVTLTKDISLSAVRGAVHTCRADGVWRPLTGTGPSATGCRAGGRSLFL